MPTFCHKLLTDCDIALRFVCFKPMYLHFTTSYELQQQLELLETNLMSCVFNYADIYLSKLSNTDVANAFLNSLFVNDHASRIHSVRLLFNYQLKSDEHSPFVKVAMLQSPVHKLKINIDGLCSLKRNISPDKVHEVLCRGVDDYLLSYYKSLQQCSNSGYLSRSIYSYHYIIDHHIVTIFYSNKSSEEEEHLFRSQVHLQLGLPNNAPLFRRGQALLPVPYICRWLGPSDSLLVCPHEELKPPPGNGQLHLIQGRYTYKHYMQDNIDDKNWGCAYRSLQTLISWLMWQGEIMPARLPTLTDIQSSLVRVGDKPKSFVGSRQWIGSLEVSFCLQEMYDVQCRILPVSRGSEMVNVTASELARHFDSGGGPVMIGGGQLAHTIIGVQLCKDTSNLGSTTKRTVRYLIVDPHYTGPSSSLRTILDKGWVGWKESNFWKPEVFYNLCFLPAIRPGRL